MKLRPKITITDHFSELEDPRIERTKLHKLIDIITITICAVICGADGWKDIELNIDNLKMSGDGRKQDIVKS